MGRKLEGLFNALLSTGALIPAVPPEVHLEGHNGTVHALVLHLVLLLKHPLRGELFVRDPQDLLG
jgi:hypothetical protein